MAGMISYQVLVRELQATVRDLALDALRGDEPSRRWLLSMFPGHDLYFHRFWSEHQDGKLRAHRYTSRKRLQGLEM